MNRAERRRLERRNRIDDKKGKIYLSPEDIKKMKSDISYEVSNFSVEAMLTCFALVLHDQYGFGQKRLERALRQIDSL